MGGAAHAAILRGKGGAFCKGEGHVYGLRRWVLSMSLGTRHQVGRTLVLEGDWPIGLHKVALQAPKLPSKERAYTEQK